MALQASLSVQDRRWANGTSRIWPLLRLPRRRGRGRNSPPGRCAGREGPATGAGSVGRENMDNLSPLVKDHLSTFTMNVPWTGASLIRGLFSPTNPRVNSPLANCEIKWSRWRDRAPQARGECAKCGSLDYRARGRGVVPIRGGWGAGVTGVSRTMCSSTRSPVSKNQAVTLSSLQMPGMNSA